MTNDAASGAPLRSSFLRQIEMHLRHGPGIDHKHDHLLNLTLTDADELARSMERQPTT